LKLEPAYVALGSNLNDPDKQVRAGIEELAMIPDTRLSRSSSLYRSAPVGYRDQPDFTNAVARIETALTPRELLDALLAVEQRYGRVRDFPNAPRTLDLDIVLFGDSVVQEPGLTIPHPRMHERAFVLMPLAEIAPYVIVPGCGPVSELLARVNSSGLTKMQSPEE
jgi:2-amino-4-hydroxy-6-hydroxymethyldihydropteridine diphosphokinase